jgi:peptide/nickel transport system substrate-binding protein
MCEPTATLWSKKSACFHGGLLPYPFDRERAAQLLDEAGWRDTDGDGVRDRAGQPLAPTFLMPTASTSMDPVVTAYKEDLRKVGIRLEISRMDWEELFSRVLKRDFDLVGMNNTYFSSRMDAFDSFHSSQVDGGANYPSYKSADMDALLEKMREELDEERRCEIERSIQELAYEDVPYLLPFAQRVPGIVHKRFRGVKPSVEWYQLREWWIPKRLQAKTR